MSFENAPARRLSELQPTIQSLFQDIFRSPSSYSTETNPLVAPIHLAWKNAQEREDVEPGLRDCLRTPRDFVEKAAPKQSKVAPGLVLRGLGHRVGIYIQTEADTFGIQTYRKKGRFVSRGQAPQEPEWVSTNTNDVEDVYVKREVIEELRHHGGVDIYGCGFHATTSATLDGIERRGAIVSSKTVLESGELLTNGEVLGADRYCHSHVYVYTDKISDGYGTPRWFDEYTVVFGISMEKQREYLERHRKSMGMWSRSDGCEVGEDVPLENLDFIAAHSVYLGKLIPWVRKNCPSVSVISREALYLKYRK